MLPEQEVGVRTEEVCRRHEISSAILYKWKSKYGGLEVSGCERAQGAGRREPALEAAAGRFTTLQRVRSGTRSEKTSEACGAARSSDQGDGASRAESAA